MIINSIRKTYALICPASRSPDVLERMMEAGMIIARIILESETYDYHTETIKNIRKARENYSEKIGMKYSMAIGVDTRGPEIRIGTVDRGGAAHVQLKKGESIKLTTDIEYLEKGNNKIIYVNYENITKFVSRGNRIYLNNGAISLICIGTGSVFINCIIEVGGTLPRYADVRIPGVALDLPDVSNQDRIDLAFALDQEVDIIFASFIRNIFGAVEIRNIISKKGDKVVLISKIESLEGVKNIKEIINASDGIMIMRDLLGLEVPTEKIFLIQKFISSTCTITGKPVICATQVLESMVKRNKPSRPEIADVANAVVDGMDCVLLTEETAKGSDPVSYISHMIVICKEAEAVTWQKEVSLTVRSKVKPPTNIPVGVAMSAVEAVEKCEAAAIIVLTGSGKTPKLLSQYRPQCPIIAITRNQNIIPKIILYRSIIPLFFEGPADDDWVTDVDIQLNYGVKYGVKRKFIKASDMIIAVTTWKKGFDYTSTLRYICANDIMELV
ncbi:hypothetical protein RN001_000650 [Aquatica leii]|uniref:Pyruvate kinase n=1 Tax=Aquatica leii TaxID=1421715 RepID=A0AAN7PF75_9COLE|nr:hypothetical protein RN001_000650 [Aquatica leii]